MSALNDIESLVSLEQTFYDEGYADGFAHGRIHGLIEGRALGREKGYEMWEEIGFYEGFGQTWMNLLMSTGQGGHRGLSHAKALLDLISQFPRVNPSTAATSASDPSHTELDIPKLFRQIRSRYKVLCSSLSIRPSLRAAEGDDGGQDASGEVDTSSGPVKLKKSVWKLDGGGTSKPGEPQGLSF